MPATCTAVESRATATTLQMETKTAGIGTSLRTENWFSRCCKALFAIKPGLALHLATRAGESTCYRYASGERVPPLEFFRRLVHGAQGRTWLYALMEGCAEPWWQEMKDAMEIQDAVKRAQEEQRKRAGQK